MTHLTLCMVMDKMTREFRASIIPAEIGTLETEEEIDRLSDSLGFCFWGTVGFGLSDLEVWVSDHPRDFAEAVDDAIKSFKAFCTRKLAEI